MSQERNKNLAAYTAPTPPSGYPEYISINQRPDNAVVITVRAPTQLHPDQLIGIAGDINEIVLTPEAYAAFARQVARTNPVPSDSTCASCLIATA